MQRTSLVARGSVSSPRRAFVAEKGIQQQISTRIGEERTGCARVGSGNNPKASREREFKQKTKESRRVSTSKRMSKGGVQRTPAKEKKKME